MQFKSRKNQTGQAVLIVLLSLSVVLIVILYILSRSITDISLSSKEEDSLRAFSAAEAGVEKALVGLFAVGSSSGDTPIGDASFNASVTAFSAGSPSSVFPIPLKSGQNATFWFMGRNPDGSLGCPASDPCFTGNQARFCWGDPGTASNGAETPAVEVTVYYRTVVGGVYMVGRKTFDSYAGRPSLITLLWLHLLLRLVTFPGENFQFQSTVNFTNIVGGLNIPGYSTAGVLQYATVKLLYNNTIAHKVAIDVSGAGSLLPSQGVKVNSVGNFGGTSGANRSIEVYQLYPEVPSIFTNVIYSGSGVTK